MRAVTRERGTGHATTALVRKLGLKPGMRVRFIGAPDDYQTLLEGLPAVIRGPSETLDFAQMFVMDRKSLADSFPKVMQRLTRDGSLWVSWPKRSSGVTTDLTQDVVRSVGLANGMVDVKACAINATWSGLKFVYRKEDR